MDQGALRHGGLDAGVPGDPGPRRRGRPEDTAVLGDEETVAREIQRFADAGATEFMVAAVGTPEQQARTIAFAHELAKNA